MTALNPEIDIDDLSGEITRLVRSIDGVTAVYSSKHLVKTAVATMVEKVKHDTIGIHLVRLTQAPGGLEVVATIGVADEEPARDVCERVYAAINSYLSRGRTGKPAAIRVKVGRVG